MGRNTQGVRLVSLKDDDALVGVEVVTEDDLEAEARTSGEGAEGEASGEASAEAPAEPASNEEASTDEGAEGEEE